jgi:hypothetical protein
MDTLTSLLLLLLSVGWYSDSLQAHSGGSACLQRHEEGSSSFLPQNPKRGMIGKVAKMQRNASTAKPSVFTEISNKTPTHIQLVL